MTVLGDLAQGTSPWAQERWEDVARLLGRHGVRADLVHLELAYRLPAEVHEVAMRLLPVIGPALTAPQAKYVVVPWHLILTVVTVLLLLVGTRMLRRQRRRRKVSAPVESPWISTKAGS